MPGNRAPGYFADTPPARRFFVYLGHLSARRDLACSVHRLRGSCKEAPHRRNSKSHEASSLELPDPGPAFAHDLRSATRSAFHFISLSTLSRLSSDPLHTAARERPCGTLRLMLMTTVIVHVIRGLLLCCTIVIVAYQCYIGTPWSQSRAYYVSPLTVAFRGASAPSSPARCLTHAT